MLLELTLPPAAAWVAVVWLQRVPKTSERVAALELRVVELIDDRDKMRASLEEAHQLISRLADQRMS